MELPRRARGDERLAPGEFTRLVDRLRSLAPRHDLATVIAYAFDRRTRMLPFIYADMHMAPAGVRAIGSALAACGFDKTRIVLQQWNPRFRPSQMRLGGRIPDLFCVSSMQIHTAACHALIRDCGRIDPAQRPLIVAGGPKTNYEPWDVFGTDPDDPWGADVAVTGEEFVLLSLLEVVLDCRGRGESLRQAFARARDGGLLEHVPGLLYPRVDERGVPNALIDTGVQRLLGDLDELPHPAAGFRMLERPSRWRTTLQASALEPSRVRGRSPIASLVLTFGCKFACPYCPIPAYNQRQFRQKSPGRIVEEMRRLRQEFGLRFFFGADDNFFNDHARTHEICETLANSEIDGRPLRKLLKWGTEVTVHDTIALRDDLRTVRRAGVRMLWLGVEDITATFVKKGQSGSKTQEAFEALRSVGIAPMPMMMHHDGQPLYTPGSAYGLLNQVRLLWRWGAPSLQVLMMTPATGSKLYEQPYRDGIVIARAGGRRVDPYMLDGNYVVATTERQPWRKQFNILAAYFYFYNPLRFARSLLWPRDRMFDTDAVSQVLGIYGLVQTVRRTLGWALRLRLRPIRFGRALPVSRLPMTSPSGERASHDLPRPDLVQIGGHPARGGAAARSGPLLPIPLPVTAHPVRVAGAV